MVESATQSAAPGAQSAAQPGVQPVAVHVLYFARLREQIGRNAEWVELPPDVRTAGALRHHLVGRGGVFGEALGPGKTVRVAVDQIMVGDDARLTNGAEVAFFPPVTGG
ncbi:MAG: molybdopterin converting factor subunit 1 [Burkholderiaceae bacterium]